MIKNTGNIFKVKEKITALYGKNVEVTVDLGRNKKQVFKGVLDTVYPSLFSVKPFEAGYLGKTTYSYTEYLCGRVKLSEIASVGGEKA